MPNTQNMIYDYQKGRILSVFFVLLFSPLFLIASSDERCEDEALSWGLYCPPDAYAACTDELWDLDAFGWAYVHDYNGDTYLYQPQVSYHLSSCNTGYITRTWSAENPYTWAWSTCTQTIHVGSSYNGAFSEHDIHWPEPVLELDGCNPETDPYILGGDFGPPRYNYLPCTNIGISYSDRLFTVNSTCKKIIRTWIVADWCTYNSNNHNGRFEFEQTIKIINGDVPNYTCPADPVVGSSNCTDATVYIDPVHVDPTACGGIYTVTNFSPYAFSNGADISGVYPVGVTNVKVVINYGCGYKKNCWIKVTVDKNKPPIPYCLHTIVTALMPVDSDNDGVVDDGMVEIWAKDLDKGSTASCGAGPVKFSFSADVNDKSRMFTCANVGRNPVQVWVTDWYGNQDWCLSYVEVQNNSANIPNCEPVNYNPHQNTPLSALGSVHSAWNEPLNEMIMEMTDMDVWLPNYRYDSTIVFTVDTIYAPDGTMAFMDNHELHVERVQVRPTEHPTYSAESNADGFYLFQEELAEQASYMVTAMNYESPMGSIDFFDANMLMSHLLGYKLFTHPYQYIAADVNQDHALTTADFVLLYNHIKHGTALPAPKKWVVVDADYQWETPESALNNCPDEINFLTAEGTISGVDFVAIEIGDITDLDQNSLTSNNVVTSLSKDGSESNAKGEIVSEMRELVAELNQESLSVYPNPFHNGINLAFNASIDETVTITFYAADGRMLESFKNDVRSGDNLITVKTSFEYSGIVLYTMNTSAKTYAGRLIKQ